MNSDVDYARKVLSNPNLACPAEILDQQVSLVVSYIGFDGIMHRGVLELSRHVVDDAKAFFELAVSLSFPLHKIAPASDTPYQWNDDKIMEANVSSGFNYRLIAGTKEPSLHGKGLAFDINPRQNPYIRYVDGKEIVAPYGAVWQPDEQGTLSSRHPLVEFMTERGWEWGGNWPIESGRIDYQHFQKSL